MNTSWTSVRFDHADATGTCYSCHNGTSAPGKTNTHLATSNTCDDCHVTTSWTNVRFDHADVTALLGNRVVLEALSAIARRRKDDRDGTSWDPRQPLLDR